MGKRKTAPIWSIDLYNDNGNTAKCKKCDTDVPKPNGSINCMVNHLEKHKEFKLKYEKQKFKAESVKSSAVKSIDSYIDKVGEPSSTARKKMIAMSCREQVTMHKVEP
jgi:hypothetical protein